MMTDFTQFAMIAFGVLALIYALARILSRRKPRGPHMIEAQLFRYATIDANGESIASTAFDKAFGKAGTIRFNFDESLPVIEATLHSYTIEGPPDDPDLPHPADEARWWVIACQGGGYLSVYRMIRPDPDLPLRLSGGLSIAARRWRVFYGPCLHAEAVELMEHMHGIDGFPVRESGEWPNDD